MTTPLTLQTPVSVILPVLNEERYLEATISAITSQEYSGPIEIILALGPSRDRTNELAANLAAGDPRIRLVDNPSGKTADALNMAISASSAPIIVRVDGHSILPPGYIKEAVATLLRTGAVNVGGVMAAKGVSKFERVVAVAMRSAFGVGGASFHVGGSEGPADTVYLGVFLRSALAEISGFDPRFIRAQDWELNYRLRKKGGLIYFNPRLEVTYRPRPNLPALAKQYLEYGRWRREVARSHIGTLNARYLAPPLTLIGTALGLLGSVLHPIFLALPLMYLTFILIGTLNAFVKNRSIEMLIFPLILITMHFSWAWGFLTSRRQVVDVDV
jgi:cellulose synthase/poly-beta-1,6-N-acetylglucosamine synthase-like glycosyltransferase